MTTSTMHPRFKLPSSLSLRTRLTCGAMMTLSALAVASFAPTALAEQTVATKTAQSSRPQMKQKAEQAFKSGEKAFKAGDLKGAETQFKAAIAADKKAYLGHYGLGVVQERMGNSSGAAKSYRAALDIVPDHEPSVVAYSLILARQGKYDEAFDFVQKRPNSAGPSAALVAAKAEVRSLQGRSGEAQELAQQALKIDPNFKGAMVTLARDHYRARRIDLALYALTGILDGYGNDNPPRDKNNAEARMLRGLIYAERNLRGPAMEEMEKALKARPDLVDAHLILANYMMQAGNAKDARPHLESAIRYDSRNVGAHLQLGDAYRLLGRPDDARRELEWVLKADPNQAAARYNLGLVFLLGGTLKGMSEAQAVDKAIEHLEAYKARAVRGGPDDVEELITRAKTKQAMLKSQQGGQQAPAAEGN